MSEQDKQVEVEVPAVIVVDSIAADAAQLTETIKAELLAYAAVEVSHAGNLAAVAEHVWELRNTFPGGPRSDAARKAIAKVYEVIADKAVRKVVVAKIDYAIRKAHPSTTGTSTGNTTPTAGNTQQTVGAAVATPAGQNTGEMAAEVTNAQGETTVSFDGLVAYAKNNPATALMGADQVILGATGFLTSPREISAEQLDGFKAAVRALEMHVADLKGALKDRVTRGGKVAPQQAQNAA